MKKITGAIHLPTLGGLMAAYALAVSFIFCIPHRADGFGRMSAHEVYAETGKVLSFRLVDRTLDDWYMFGPTLEENIRPYNRIIARSILHLTPVFLAWFIILGVAGRRLISGKFTG